MAILKKTLGLLVVGVLTVGSAFAASAGSHPDPATGGAAGVPGEVGSVSMSAVGPVVAPIDIGASFVGAFTAPVGSPGAGAAAATAGLNAASVDATQQATVNNPYSQA